MIWRKLPADPAIRFADAVDIAGYAREAVAAVRQTGIMQGVSGDRFDPRADATRAMAATVIYRLYQKIY